MTDVSVTKQCTVDGCLKTKWARGVCNNHYRKLRLSGELSLSRPHLDSPICVVDDCNAVRIRGNRYCQVHHWRMKRYGNATTYQRNLGDGNTQEQRFWSKVDKTPGLGRDGDCWEWRGSMNITGYGAAQITLPNKILRTAHRVAYYLHTHKVPQLNVLHSCDNRRCVNPDHLREGTALDNKKDAMRRGRHVKGEQINTSKLTEQQVLAMRADMNAGMTCKKAAEVYGVTLSTTARIKHRTYWKHI